MRAAAAPPQAAFADRARAHPRASSLVAGASRAWSARTACAAARCSSPAHGVASSSSDAPTAPGHAERVLELGVDARIDLRHRIGDRVLRISRVEQSAPDRVQCHVPVRSDLLSILAPFAARAAGIGEHLSLVAVRRRESLGDGIDARRRAGHYVAQATACFHANGAFMPKCQ